MILVHDLVEAEVGPRKQAKAEREQKAIARIRDMLEPELCAAVKLEGEEKMKAGGVDVEAVKKRLSL